MHKDQAGCPSVTSNDSAFLKWYNKANSKLEATNKELTIENVRLAEENGKLMALNQKLTDKTNQLIGTIGRLQEGLKKSTQVIERERRH